MCPPACVVPHPQLSEPMVGYGAATQMKPGLSTSGVSSGTISALTLRCKAAQPEPAPSSSGGGGSTTDLYTPTVSTYTLLVINITQICPLINS